MDQHSKRKPNESSKSQNGFWTRMGAEQGSARPVVLAVVCFLLGVGAGGLWFYQSGRPRAENVGQQKSQPSPALSASTQRVLDQLSSPIEIRFYSLLDPKIVPQSTQNYAERVNHLLSEYREEAHGKITVTQINSMTDANADAASADGLKPFNLDKGNACYLGIAVSKPGHRESLPELSPEWESALEFDLTRTIERVAAAKPPAKSVALNAPKTDAATVAEVKQVIPDLSSVSVQEGTRILREAALEDFAAAVTKIDAQVKQARQRLSQAQQGASEAELQAAMKQLQQVQAEQTEKLKEIAARLQSQISALEKLKGVSPEPQRPK